MTPSHGRIILTFVEPISEVTPSVDNLLGRAAAYPQLQARASNEIGGACVLSHVVWILVPHVDDCGSDLDLSCSCANRREKWKRR